MRDLKSPAALWIKGGLFLLVGVIASAIILLEHPSVRVGLLLAVAIWAFARAYYFAFYVIEHYVDSSFRYAGLWSFFKYVVKGRWNER